jgi:hypothetical protein
VPRCLQFDIYFSRQIPQYFAARKVHNRTVPLCSHRQIPQYFSTRKVHNRTVPLCSKPEKCTIEPSPCVQRDKKDGTRLNWLENSNSSVSLAEQKLAQLIGNRQKLESRATSENFSIQIPPGFPASKVHNRTVPLCSVKCTTEPSPCVHK